MLTDFYIDLHCSVVSSLAIVVKHDSFLLVYFMSPSGGANTISPFMFVQCAYGMMNVISESVYVHTWLICSVFA